MKLNFVTPTQISYLDLITMGGSEKAGDDSKIGQFASGLKYAMALMLRNNIDFTVKVFGDTIVNKYSLEKYPSFDTRTSKRKDLMLVRESSLEGAINCGSRPHQTGFSVDLGTNWELWMVLRELYSNMKDEDGFYYTGEPLNPLEGVKTTVMTLEFDDDSDFATIWENRNLYVNEEEPLFEINDRLKAYKNPSGHLRIFKKGVLVYEDTEKFSQYAYEIGYGEIDERRILSNISGIKNQIAYDIATSTNDLFLAAIVRGEEWVNDNDFLQAVSFYGTISNNLKDRINDVFKNSGEVHTYEFLLEKAKESPDCEIDGRVIRSVSDHLWNYSGNVTVNETKTQIETKADSVDLKSQIEAVYKIKIDCIVKVSSIEGSEVVADKFNKVLLVGESFNFHDSEHFGSFLVQYVDLTRSGNLLKNLSVMFAENLKR